MTQMKTGSRNATRSGRERQAEGVKHVLRGREDGSVSGHPVHSDAPTGPEIAKKRVRRKDSRPAPQITLPLPRMIKFGQAAGYWFDQTARDVRPRPGSRTSRRLSRANLNPARRVAETEIWAAPIPERR
jgi:hypothetical protein